MRIYARIHFNPPIVWLPREHHMNNQPYSWNFSKFYAPDESLQNLAHAQWIQITSVNSWSESYKNVHFWSFRETIYPSLCYGLCNWNSGDTITLSMADSVWTQLTAFFHRHWQLSLPRGNSSYDRNQRNTAGNSMNSAHREGGEVK